MSVHAGKDTSATRPVALVTGAARRLGAAIVRTLHAEGYDLVLHYRSSERDAQALAQALNDERAGSVLVLQADLDDMAALPAIIDHAVRRFGRLDALVNNASTFFATPLGSATPAQWDALFSSNARAPFFLAQAAAPHLRATGGAIVNLVDIHGQRPLHDHAIYAMAKAALVMATRALALELAPDVRVNAVAPGAILWPEGNIGNAGASVDGGLVEGHVEAAVHRADLLARTPLGRTGTPEEIARAVLWLLRDATYTTGQVLRLDGGRLLED